MASGDEGIEGGGRERRREPTTFLPEGGDKITRPKFRNSLSAIATTGSFRGNVTRLVDHMTSPRTPVENVSPPTFLRDEGIDNPRAPRCSHTNERFFVRLTPLRENGVRHIISRRRPIDDDDDDRKIHVSECIP